VRTARLRYVAVAAPPKDLALVRLALVTFTPKPSGWREWAMRMDDIEVSPASAYERDENLTLLVGAATVLDYRPRVSADGEVVVPPKQREAAERAIELSANLIAVAQGCRRKIASPWPPVVFVATGEEGRAWLAERVGLQHRPLKGIVRTREQIDLDESVLNELSDREDGVALMVEALAHDHATGRFHEFVRLFERAFACPAKTLGAALAAFLNPRFGYDKDELSTWFEELRDPATHADARNEFLLEADLQPVIDRMEQAAFDVLLNKATWRDSSATRKEVWRPTAGTMDADGGAFIVKGTTPVTSGTILDEYGAFPVDLGAGVVATRPEHWWPQEDAPSSKTESFSIRIIEDD
jgi:hypothetical protein